MEFDYLRGNKALFAGANEAAMVVYELPDTGEVFFAESTTPGTRYWHADGSPGLRIGLIGTRLNKLVLMAERRPKAGEVARAAVRSAANPDRFNMIMTAAKRAEAPAAEPAPAAAIIPPEPIPPTSDTGFLALDQFDFADRKEPPQGEIAISISPRLKFSVRKALADEGDHIEVQLNPQTHQLRLRKVTEGGQRVRRGRAVGCAKLSHSLSFPDGKSFSMLLSPAEDGWLYGDIPEANRGRLSQIRRIDGESQC